MEVNSGSEFGAHRINKDGSWDSEFKRRIGELGIKPILQGSDILRQTEN